MATLGGDVLTLADIAKQLDPKGMPAKVINRLSRANPIAGDAPWMPTNKQTSHLSTITIGEPTINLRRINEGTAPSKATFGQVEDGLSLMDAWSHTDAKALKLSNHPEAMRFNQARGFISSFAKKFEELFWSGDESTDDREFYGMSTRYATLGDNVLNCSGNGTQNSSMYLICWGEYVHCSYPMGTQAGVRHSDHGLRPWQTTAGLGGNTIEAYVDHWEWDAGLVVADPRYAVRIANIDLSDMNLNTSTQALGAATELSLQMTRALKRIPNISEGKPCFYAPRNIVEELDVQALRRTQDNIYVTKDFDGEAVTTFRNVPIKVADELGYSEAVIS